MHHTKYGEGNINSNTCLRSLTKEEGALKLNRRGSWEQVLQHHIDVEQTGEDAKNY